MDKLHKYVRAFLVTTVLSGAHPFQTWKTAIFKQRRKKKLSGFEDEVFFGHHSLSATSNHVPSLLLLIHTLCVAKYRACSAIPSMRRTVTLTPRMACEPPHPNSKMASGDVLWKSLEC